MKLLVTGGGGFLGSAIVGQLRDRGHEVVALGRHRYPYLDALGVRTIQADICDADAIRTSLSGFDAVFHVAALAGIWGPKRHYWNVNVDGTCHVLDACRANRIPHLIYTSSPSVVFAGQDLCGVNESTHYPDRFLARYPETKAVSERMVLAANSNELATVALRPHLIWGPGDPHLIPRVIDRARRGKLWQVGDGKNLVDISFVENAAVAHVQAWEALRTHGRCAGKAYFISQGEPVQLWPWLNEILERIGAPPVTRRMSYKTAYRFGTALELIYRILHLPGEPRMTRFLADQLAKSHYFDITAAGRDLGYSATVSTREGMDRLLRWLRDRDSAAQNHRVAT